MILSLISLLIYTSALVLSTFLIHRHGLNSSIGFIFLLLFSFLRILSNVFTILVHHISDPSHDLGLKAYITSSAGLSFLLLATAGLLFVIHQTSTSASADASGSGEMERGVAGVRYWVRRLIELTHLSLFVAFILSVVGAVTGRNTIETSSSKTSQATACLYAVSLVLLVVSALLVFLAQLQPPIHGPMHVSLHRSEKHLLYAVLLSSPFLTVRVVYGLLGVFWTKDTTFVLFGGNLGVRAGMCVVMEWVVVWMYLGAGSFLEEGGSGEEGE